MKRRNFFAWYYSRGLKDYLIVWKNFLWTAWNFFSVGILFKTLFSPWKKDLISNESQGFNPVEKVQNAVINLIFRFFGALVRLSVILVGLAVDAVFLVLGLVVFVIWVFFPIIVVGLIVGLATDKIYILNRSRYYLKDPEMMKYLISQAPTVDWTTIGITKIELFLIIGLLVIFMGLVIFSYFKTKIKPYSEMSFEEILDQKWSDRILARMGVDRPSLIEVINNEEDLIKFLKSNELSLDDFKQIIRLESEYQEYREEFRCFWRKKYLEKLTPIGKYWSYGYTGRLDSCSLEISKSDPTQYRRVELVGHKDELELMILGLARKSQNNIILMGDAGIGKRSLAHHLARMVRLGHTGKKLGDVRVMSVNLGEAVSKARHRKEDPEHFLNQLFIETANAGNIILLIENAGKYLDPEKSTVNVAAVIDEYLQIPSFRVLMTVTKKAFHNYIENYENLMKGFQVIEVKEPTESEALDILVKNFKKYEEAGVVFTFHGLREIIEKSAQLGKITPLPERAISFATEILSYWEKNPDDFRRVTPKLVHKVMTVKTGVSHGAVEGAEKEKLLKLEELLHRRVIGQKRAIDQIANSVRKMRAGIRNVKKPVGSYLFLGPTGVGKTETAKSLAEVHFGDENRIMRFDMSEYQAPNSIGRFIGSQETGQPGILTSKIKDNPFSLVLFDEIEKAYPAILDLFLQILDEGHLTDAFGEKVSFCGAIIITTSNAGAPLIRDLVAKGIPQEEINKRLVDHIIEKGFFRPEFLNRFDDVIFFEPLNQEQLIQVVDLMLNGFVKRVEKERNIYIKFGEGVDRKVIEEGYDPAFGARSISRFIGNNIENVVARKLIKEETKKNEILEIKIEDLK